VDRIKTSPPSLQREDLDAPVPSAAEAYTVVARRYRPQRFEDVVGQDHIVEALRNAIQLHRIAHAYLFCGTRGVGKTSMARIFAKCLNCVRGTSIHPCLECDICQAIAEGQDVDVIEIDGASNNGVDSVRELRQNAGLRPSRSRFKIYYIDEVHMLSTGAFNALLKTLEEPPEHVKFLFATTEAHKIPVTVLSRCQKFDFAPIGPEAIAESLQAICGRERIEADGDALRTIARRAAGSMRDAQSLLEQLLSSADRHLTTEDVHRILGVASDERVLDLLDALAHQDAGLALTLVDQAVSAGVQPADLLGGALEFLRDAMVLGVGATQVEPLAAAPSQKPRVQALAEHWGLDSVLAAMQILDTARARLRGSPHGRLIVELALCRVARLERLVELGELVNRLTTLEANGPPPVATSSPPPPPRAVAGPVKKKSEEPVVIGVGPQPRPDPSPPAPVNVSEPRPPDPSQPLSLPLVQAVWPRLAERVGKALSGPLKHLQPAAIFGPDTLAVTVDSGYNWAADRCETPEAKSRIESALQSVLGRTVSLRIERVVSEAPVVSVPHPGELSDDPLVQRVVELFEARPVRIEAEGQPDS
jgi:DNA polymerase-3 subunit gamma/tau